MQRYSGLQNTLNLSLAAEPLSQLITRCVKVAASVPAPSKALSPFPFPNELPPASPTRLVSALPSTDHPLSGMRKSQQDFQAVYELSLDPFFGGWGCSLELKIKQSAHLSRRRTELRCLGVRVQGFRSMGLTGLKCSSFFFF